MRIFSVAVFCLLASFIAAPAGRAQDWSQCQQLEAAVLHPLVADVAAAQASLDKLTVLRL